MNEAVSGVAPFGLADFRAGMAEVQGGAPRLPSAEGPSGAVPSAGGPPGLNRLVGYAGKPGLTGRAVVDGWPRTGVTAAEPRDLEAGELQGTGRNARGALRGGAADDRPGQDRQAGPPGR